MLSKVMQKNVDPHESGHVCVDNKFPNSTCPHSVQQFNMLVNEC